MWLRVISTTIMLAATSLLYGCGEEETSITGVDDNAPIRNFSRPNANDRIIYESAFGDTTAINSINIIEPCMGGEFYFYGYRDGRMGVGKISNFGHIYWFRETRHYYNDIVSIPLSAGDISDGCILVGFDDVDDDGVSDRGIVSLFLEDGTEMDSLSYSGDSSGLWLNSIAWLRDSTFVVVGCLYGTNSGAPFAATFGVNREGNLFRIGEAVVEGLPNTCFGNVVTDPDDGVQLTGATFYVSDELVDPSDASARIKLHKLSSTTVDLSSLNIEWSENTAPFVADPHYARPGRSLVCWENRLLLAGYMEMAKGPGRYFYTCYASCVLTTGQFNWTTIRQVSSYGDRYFSARILNGEFYAAGLCSSYIMMPEGRTLSYKLLSKYDPVSGDEIFDYIFGDDTHSSAIFDFCVSEATAKCAGLKERWTMYGGYMAWLTEMDIISPPDTTGTSIDLFNEPNASGGQYIQSNPPVSGWPPIAASSPIYPKLP
jgi:hypothetical protein